MSENHFFLLVLSCDKGQVDLQSLRTVLMTRKMEFASELDLEEIFHTYPGNVSIFHSVYDSFLKVTILFDQELVSQSCLAFHPLYNGDTIFLAFSQVKKYLDQIHHEYFINFFIKIKA